MPGSVGYTLFAKTGNIDNVVSKTADIETIVAETSTFDEVTSDTATISNTELVAVGFTKSGGGQGFLINSHQTGATAVDVGPAKASKYPSRISRYMFILDCLAINIPAGGSKDFCFKDGDKLGENELEKATAFINYTTTGANIMVRDIEFDAGAVKMTLANLDTNDFPGQLRLVVDFCPRNEAINIEVNP